MKPLNIDCYKGFWFAVLLLIFSMVTASSAWAHGAKGHGGQTFTAYQAVQKGLQLFDKLLTKNKIDEGFEIHLTKIQVNKGTHKGKSVFVTKIERSQGEPKAVFIFFDASGNYVGSNFTGN